MLVFYGLEPDRLSKPTGARVLLPPDLLSAIPQRTFPEQHDSSGVCLAVTEDTSWRDVCVCTHPCEDCICRICVD